MAMNYWQSTHFKNWTSQLTVEALNESNPEDRNHFTEEELAKLNMHMISLIQELGKSLNLRQHVIGSAIVFYRRFYLKNSFVNFDPRLVIPTVIYIATKTEECQVRIDYVMHALRQLTTDKNDPMVKFKQTDLLECEFYIIEKLKFDLILFHPYRPLTKYLSELGLDEECLSIAWRIVNDSYGTHAVMLYPPYLIALVAIYLSMIFVQRDPTDWYNKLNVNAIEFDNAKEMILHRYSSHKTTSKDELRRLITRLNQIVPLSSS